MSGLTPDAIMLGLGELVKLLPIAFALIVVIELFTWFLCAKIIRTKFTLAYVMLAPGIVGVMALIVSPFFYNMFLAFSNMSMTKFLTFSASLQIGLQNLIDVFTVPVLQRTNIGTLIIRTIIWTFVNVFFHVTLGMFLGILLNRPLKLKNVYKSLLILPWAVPEVITSLTWRNEFHYQYGFVNIILKSIGLEPIMWFQDPFWAMISCIFVNIWLGVPFMMVITLGGLQSIPQDYYDVAQIDGAGGWKQFVNITLPLLRPILTPATALGIIWTFNKFNVIYLMYQGGPIEGTHILITAMFSAIFENYRYGFGAMYSLVLFVMLLGISSIYYKIAGGFKEVSE